MLKAVYRVFLPQRRLLLMTPKNEIELEKLLPAARTYKFEEGPPVAYLCHHFTCLPGIHDAADLARELEQFHPEKNRTAPNSP